MKKRTYSYWLWNFCVPSVIACVISAYAALYFAGMKDGVLTQVFIVLLTLSFIGLCISAHLCIKAMVSQTKEELEAAHERGLSSSAMVWFFFSLAVGIVLFVALILNDAGLPASTFTGFASFFLLAFTPVIYKKKLEKRAYSSGNSIEEHSSECPVDTSTETEPVLSEGTRQEETIESEYIGNDDTLDNIIFPTNFPDELRKRFAIKVLFVELARQQILDKDFRPVNISLTQQTLLINAICDIFGIQAKWKTFAFWEKDSNKLANSLSQALKRETRLDEKIFSALKEAQKNTALGSIRAYNSWISKNEPNYR